MKLIFNGFGLKLYQQGGKNINKITQEIDHEQVWRIGDQTHMNKP